MWSRAPEDELLIELYVQAERAAGKLVGRDRAEAIASETIVRALARWPRVGAYPHAWVTRVAVNLAIDELRKKQVQLWFAPPASFEEKTVQRLDLTASLHRLSRRQREAVVLHYLLGFSNAEAAQTMQVSVPTINAHLARALTALRRSVPEVNLVSTDPT